MDFNFLVAICDRFRTRYKGIQDDGSTSLRYESFVTSLRMGCIVALRSHEYTCASLVEVPCTSFAGSVLADDLVIVTYNENIQKTSCRIKNVFVLEFSWI